MLYWKFFILLISNFCFVLHPIWAQRDALFRDTLHLQKRFILRTGFDLLGLGQYVFLKNKFSLHLNADMGIRNKNLFTIEFTRANRKETQQAIYQAWGSILRIGWSHNFLYKQSSINVLAVGVRVANAWYGEEVDTILQNPIFGNNAVVFQHNLQASWIEFALDLKAKIWKNLMLGYILRYQFRPMIRGNEGFVSYSIPSVGQVKRNNWGFQYTIYYLLDFN